MEIRRSTAAGLQRASDRLARRPWRPAESDGQWGRAWPVRFESAEHFEWLLRQLAAVTMVKDQVRVVFAPGGSVAVDLAAAGADVAASLASLSEKVRRRDLTIHCTGDAGAGQSSWTLRFTAGGRNVLGEPVVIEQTPADRSTHYLVPHIQRVVEDATVPYRWWHRLSRTPLVGPQTTRDVYQQRHDRRQTRKAVGWGIFAGAVSGILSGVTAGSGWPWS